MTYVIVGWVLFCIGFVLGALWATRKLRVFTTTVYLYGEEVGAVSTTGVYARKRAAKAGSN